ncbi:MAG: S41 family peptidase [Chloroflexi bacterium]|nr:S41 family peptidase [Chloroflexota bacterium]
MKKFIQIGLILVLSILLLTGTFAGGFMAGHFTDLSALGSMPYLGSPLFKPLTTPQGSSSATPDNLVTLFQPFWETWNLVHKQFVDQPVDDTKLMRGAINGMLGALGDEHTSYMDPVQFKQADSSLAGAYEGIGAYVDTTGEYLKVISPISKSPAEQAGIKSGDLIIAIDGETMKGINPELVRQKVLGPAGSTVVLTIQRADTEKPLDISIVRAKITIASVESKMLDNNVAYVKLNTFGETTTKELTSQLKVLMAKNPKGLILDLRNNGGGYLQTAVEVASQFIKEGVIVSEKYGDGRPVDKSNAIAGGLATDISMVVLVNEGTASASEIVSGAIQDYGRGKLVGVTTYGKGSVQIWTPLSNDQGAVRITIAKWLTPKDRAIHKIGLIPEVVVEMTKDDYAAGRDPQLDAAVKTLLDSIK